MADRCPMACCSPSTATTSPARPTRWRLLTFAGVPTVLFLERADAAALARFRTDRAASASPGSRARRSPDWMDARTCRRTFEALARARGADRCSTRSARPSTRRRRSARSAARSTSAPPMPAAAGRRWSSARRVSAAISAFGNLFAVVDGVGHRLDRHPTMSRHPVTPMDEADLRRHLAWPDRASDQGSSTSRN